MGWGSLFDWREMHGAKREIAGTNLMQTKSFQNQLDGAPLAHASTLQEDPAVVSVRRSQVSVELPGLEPTKPWLKRKRFIA